jgi:peptidoglycan/LPS O-acetylase OafA/YrhL
MNSRIVQFLGRISYSFYLVNWLALMGTSTVILRTHFADIYGGYSALILGMICSIMLSLILGYLLHLTVEQPATSLSRYLGSKSA